MGNDQEYSLTQMKKAVEKLGPSTKKYEEATLLRFLIARSMDPDKAAKMFVEWVKWRAEFVPLGHIPDSEVQDELETRKTFLQGFTVEGYPVVLVKAKKHFPSKDHLQFKKFVVHLLDKTIASSFRSREIGNEKLVVILDLQHITLKNVDARGFISGFQFLQAYYPERLAKLYVLNMPRFFASVWKMICYFVEKATLEKILIVTNEDERREFMRAVGEKLYPKNMEERPSLWPSKMHRFRPKKTNLDTDMVETPSLFPARTFIGIFLHKNAKREKYPHN